MAGSDSNALRSNEDADNALQEEADEGEAALGASKDDRGAGGVDLSKMKLILDVPLRVTVQLGRTHQLLHDILSWDAGTVIELDKMAGEAMELFVNDRFIGLGEVVVVNERFGVRLTDITDTALGEESMPRDLPSFDKLG